MYISHTTQLSRARISRIGGYTLIELMIIVGIIGILSSLAYSAFTGYTAGADRAQAQSDLMELSQEMERRFTANRTYPTAVADLNDLEDTFEDRNPRYNFAITTTVNTYNLVATATDSRDNYDLQLTEQGLEQFRLKGAVAWTTAGGWSGMPK